MTRYLALLRGINVGGSKIIKMEVLRASFVAAGAKDVATYIQSGNVVFSHGRAERSLVGMLAKQIKHHTGFDVPVMLRTTAELAAVVAGNPFAEEHTHVFFLGTAPGKVAVAATSAERYVVSGRDLYVELPKGIGNSKLAGALTRALAGATARNWRTVLQLHAMASK